MGIICKDSENSEKETVPPAETVLDGLVRFLHPYSGGAAFWLRQRARGGYYETEGDIVLQYETLKKLAIWMGVVIVLLVAANIFVVVADIPGKDKTATQAASGSVLTIRDTVTSGNWQYTITKIDRQKTITWSGYETRSEAKGIWEIVYLRANHVGSEPTAIDTTDFELRDGSENAYSVDTRSIVFGDDNQLHKPGQRYQPGASVTVALVFDVNPNATDLQLYLAMANQVIDLNA